VTLSAALREMPKVELHLHLEGSFSPERIAALARQAGERLPAPLQRLTQVDSLGALLARLDWWCGLVRSPGAASQQAFDLASRLTADGTVYAEVNPTHWRGLQRPVLLEALSAGFEQAAAAGLCDCWLLVSLLRTQSRHEALDLVEEVSRRRPRRLVGLSVDGDEAASGPTGRRFAPAFAEAARQGLGLTAHAGESSGPEGVRSALDDLGVSRVDHGVRSVEDPSLLRRLADEVVTLNVCVSSNLALLPLYPDLAAHPLRALLAAGVAVTVNTDDPATLGTSLTREMEIVTAHCGWGVAEAVAATERAVDASFCSAATAGRLRRRLSAFSSAHGGIS
jgi:adenosine deaminase